MKETLKNLRKLVENALSQGLISLEISLAGETLATIGIPIMPAGGGNLLETREAKDGLALLRFLAQNDDDIALIALLRSPCLF